MAELVDALISGVSGETRADSNSVIRTIKKALRKRSFFIILSPTWPQKKKIEAFPSQPSSNFGSLI